MKIRYLAAMYQSSNPQFEMRTIFGASIADAKGIGKSPKLFYEYSVALLLPLDRVQIRLVLKAMQHCAGLDSQEIELHLVDDAASARLNKKYLGCTGPTNVITFPPVCEVAGSIYLSMDCLYRECLLYGQEADVHFLRLLAHGFGHLAGLEHGPRMELVEYACYNKGINVLKQLV